MSQELLDKGLEVTRKLWGERSGGGGMPAQKLAPEFFEMVTKFCFGGFWSRPQLDLRSRSLCTVAQLAALGKTNELKGRDEVESWLASLDAEVHAVEVRPTKEER